MRSNTSFVERCWRGPGEIITSNIPLKVFFPLLIEWSGDYSFLFLSKNGPSTVPHAWSDPVSHNPVLPLEKQEVLTVLPEIGCLSQRRLNKKVEEESSEMKFVIFTITWAALTAVHMVNVKPRFVCRSCGGKKTQPCPHVESVSPLFANDSWKWWACN